MIFARSDSDVLHNLFLSSVIWWKTQGGSAPQHPVLLFPFHNYPTQTHLGQNAYGTQMLLGTQAMLLLEFNSQFKDQNY